MMLTKKQRTWLWIGAASLAVLHFGPRYLDTLLSARERATAKPSPLRLVPVPAPAAAAPPKSAQEVAVEQYLGAWEGHSLMPDQNTCSVSLRLVRSDDPTKVTGYESKKCMPTPILQGGRIAKQSIPELIRATNPVASVLTGTPGKDDITFTVDKTIGTQPGNCDLSGFTVTSFGPGRLQAQWQEGKCGSFQMLLLKARG